MGRPRIHRTPGRTSTCTSGGRRCPTCRIPSAFLRGGQGDVVLGSNRQADVAGGDELGGLDVASRMTCLSRTTAGVETSYVYGTENEIAKTSTGIYTFSPPVIPVQGKHLSRVKSTTQTRRPSWLSPYVGHRSRRSDAGLPSGMILTRATRKLDRLARQFEDRRHHATLAEFREFSMIPPAKYVDNLKVAARAAGLPGDIVECGTWRGGMIAGLARTLGPDRRYVLFDSFEGLPTPSAQDGPSAVEYQRNTDDPRYLDNCRAERSEAERAMQLTGVPDVEVQQGWFDDTVAPWAAGARPIALLRLDGD
jgi:hypothetical protein